MSESNRIGAEQLNNVVADDFFCFLDQHDVTTACPMCGNDCFVVSETKRQEITLPHNNVKYATLFKHDTATPTERNSNYYYMLHCEKCGFNITFSAIRVYKWVSEQSIQQNKREKNDG